MVPPLGIVLAANIDLYSALTAFEKYGILFVPTPTVTQNLGLYSLIGVSCLKHLAMGLEPAT